MRLSNVFINSLLDFILRGQSLVLPEQLYVALYTTGPSDYQAGVEVSAESYHRVPIDRSLLTFSGTQGPGTTAVSDGVTGTVFNNNAIEFPAPTEDWGTIVGYALCYAETGVPYLIYCELDSPVVLGAGSSPASFSINSLSISLAARS